MANIRDSQCGKMYQDVNPPTAERISAVSSKNSAGLKMNPYLFLNLQNGQKQDISWEVITPLCGVYLTLNTSESLRDADVCLLSQILEVGVPKKYYLSPKACLGILRRASIRGKELPKVLKMALERQAQSVCATKAESEWTS